MGFLRLRRVFIIQTQKNKFVNEKNREGINSIKKWVKKHPIWSSLIGLMVIIFLWPSKSNTPTSISNSMPAEAPQIKEESKLELNQKIGISGDNKTTLTPIPVKTETKTTPAPTPVPTPTPLPSMTVSQKNAVAKAKSYLGYSAFSHDGLIAQLEYEQFSHADAVYGADNSGANWNEQAAKKAKSYMEYSAFSRGSLIAQLEYDKFTQAQAEYGANAVGL